MKGAFPMKKLWKTVAFLGTAAAFAAAGLYLFRRFFGADEELDDFEDDDLFDETDENEDDIKAFEDDSEIFEDEAPVKADEKEEEPEEEKAQEKAENAPEA